MTGEVGVGIFADGLRGKDARIVQGDLELFAAVDAKCRNSRNDFNLMAELRKLPRRLKAIRLTGLLKMC